MSVFEKRVNFKPLEYPELYDFVDAMNHSYWIFSEFNYDCDIQNYFIDLNDSERNAVKNAMLAISQIEISVKRFWSNLYNQFPKPEFDALGVTFGESEIRHSRSYAHVLELLGLNDEFLNLKNVEVIQGRIDYLSKYLKNASSNNRELYILTLALFSLFIENASLFSQFYIIKAFNKEKGFFNGIDNVIQASAKEENLHATAGAYIINIVKKEHPELFSEEFVHQIVLACKKAFEAELRIIDWIFEKGELEFLSKGIVIEYLKNRFNMSLKMLNIDPLFEINKDILKHSEWFDIEVIGENHTDFFVKTPTAYSKKTQPITSADLF